LEKAGLCCSVPGMAQFWRVKVPPRVFTAGCSEPQLLAAMAAWEEAGQQSRKVYEQKPDIRLNGGKGCGTNQSPKGKRKAEAVNQEIVRRKSGVLPREDRIACQKRCVRKKPISGGQLRP